MNYTRIKHKQFYGKAVTFLFDNGTEVLRSYNTIVAIRDPEGNIHRTWYNGWSATTGKHIRCFMALNKHEYLDIKYEYLEDVLTKCGIDNDTIYRFKQEAHDYNFKGVNQNIYFGYNRYAL